MDSYLKDFICPQLQISSKMEEISYVDKKFLGMMQKMGYKSGVGLGKNEQGITKPVTDITFQLGKKGLGMKLKNITDIEETWNFSDEKVSVEEKIEWLESKSSKVTFSKDQMQDWPKQGPLNYSENSFCDENIFQQILEAKEIFNEMDLMELINARSRANPFETIGSAFFMNRAAMKIANIDMATNFMFSNIDNDENHRGEGPFYFADVCAGPGGFSEYILWRKKWHFKGFGFTLKEENDFKINDSNCASASSFQAFYGETGDGNVCCPANIMDFKKNVMHETSGKGVHFMMSDGGFSVEGNEDLQEVLSKNIYLCQCLVALEIVRAHGHFVTKLFDIFTPFSVGLIFLMYQCFNKVAIFKPVTSRPANSERYLICSNLNKGSRFKKIKSFLWVIANKLWDLKDNPEQSILQIIPIDIIKQDESFYKFILENNNRIAQRQITGLKKMATFCRNPTLTEPRQEVLRKKALELWHIPDKNKNSIRHISIEDLLSSIIKRNEILLVQPREIKTLEAFNSTTADKEDWHYCGMCSSRDSNVCSFYAGTSYSKVFRLQCKKWVRVKNLQLCKGTVLYGEFVKEKFETKTNETSTSERKQANRYTLHVVDALQLGEMPLINMRFNERMKHIRVYCKSVNKEFQNNAVRVRQKPISQLVDICRDKSIRRIESTNHYECLLPILGFNSSKEYYDIHSLLFLKTNDSQSFQSTLVLRIQTFISPSKNGNEANFSLNEILSTMKNR